MRSCCHCGACHSPCWRRGPPEKPLLCNACGAHWLVKKSLDNYMPGQRASSATTSSNSQSTQQQLMYRQRHRLHEEAAGSTASAASAGTSVEQECLEVDQPPPVSSKKRSRLVACSVHEVDPCTNGALRCKRTFETADGCVVTVVRRVRKQLKPRASCST